MNHDIRINVGFLQHPKVKKLKHRGGPQAVLCLLGLFAWTAQNKPRGDLTGMTIEDIELAVEWNGEEGAFVRLLVDIRFLDGEPNQYSIHNWVKRNPWAAGAEKRSADASVAARARWGVAEPAAPMRPACDSHATRNAEASDPQCPISISNSISTHISNSTPISNSIPSSSSRIKGETPDADAPDACPADQDNRVAEAADQKRKGTRLPAKLTTTEKRRQPEPAKTGPTWDAYSDAYRRRHQGVEPLRDQQVNSMLSKFVARVGADDAPAIAAFYVGHKDGFYVLKSHPVEFLLRDAQKLRTEWMNGRTVTATQARQGERTAANPFAAMAMEISQIQQRDNS